KAKVAKESDRVEGASVLQAIRAMERAEVVVLLCDAKEGVAEQDAKILGLAVDRNRGIIIGLNKADLLDKKGVAEAEQNATDKLTFAPGPPILPMIARCGRAVGALLREAPKIAEPFRRRAGPGELNRFFEKVLATHPPPTSGGRAPRLYYITQAEASPPL